MTRTSPLLRHLPAAVLFLALPVLWTWPLATHLATDIPGWPGDNLAFLWNSWWMRMALAAHHTAFETDLLFAPYGIDLTLHTHTALSSWIAATLLRSLPVVIAHNLVVLGMLALNGFAAYLLAWSRVRERSAAILAGLIYGMSPYVFAHLLGHVNLLTAWSLPLLALFALRVVETGSLAAALSAGIVLTLTGFNDYYYVVYCGALVVAMVGFAAVSLEWTPGALPRLWRRIVIVLLLIDVVLALGIVLSGGGTTTVLGVRIAANRPTNLLAVAWLLLAILTLGRWRPRLRWRTPVGYAPGAWRALFVMAMTVVIGVSPLWLRGLTLLQQGAFVAPVPSWRSGPGGVDVVSFAIGNPWHGLWGSAVRSLYDRLDLNAVEGVGWLGVAPMALALLALTRHRDEREVRLWRWLGGTFLIWSLGPWLRVAGVDTGLLLPQNLLAHVPVVANARMPGRAVVVLYLAVAMLVATTVARLGVAQRARWTAVAALLTLLDFWPAPFPMTRLETPALYDTLRDLPPGVVCELPVGARDGLSSYGQFDDRVLSYQMTHGHPLIGGFAARVPPSLHERYLATPVLRSLWRLSEGQAAEEADLALAPEAAGAALREVSVRYVVVNRASASAALASFVDHSLPLRLIAKEGERELYEVR